MKAMGFLLCLFLAASSRAATIVSSFQAGDGNWQLGTLAVGNIDSDPQLEIIIPYWNSQGKWLIDAYKWDGTRVPGFPHDTGGRVANVSPSLVDVDGDGIPEILFTEGTSVTALKANGSVLWSTQINYQNYIPDGGFMVTPGKFYWSGNNSQIATLPSNTQFFSEVSSPIVADLDGDGKFEVLTSWKIDPDPTGNNQDFNPFINDIFGGAEWGTLGESWSGGVVFFDAKTGAKKYVYHLHQLVETGLGVGDVDNGPLKTFVLTDTGGIPGFDFTKPYGFYGQGQLHKQFGKHLYLLSGSYQVGIDVQCADIDGDGRDEVLVAMPELNPPWQPNETILDDDGTILWRAWKNPVSYNHVYGWQNSAVMIPCNPDHDNHADVLSWCDSSKIYFRYWNGAELVDRPGWPKDFSPAIPTPPVVGDVDGDGQEEIIIGTYLPATVPSSGNLYVFALDGTLKQSIPVPTGLKHIPFLADVNADGVLDVVYRSMSGLVSVVDFGSGNPSKVSWATHRGNAARNGRLGQSLYPPGTPLITSKDAGYGRATIGWQAPDASPTGYTVRRATSPDGPFSDLAYLGNSTSTYTDSGLETGRIYFYEVVASYPTGQVRSPPANVVPLYNNNLIHNGGFEENNENHWDKWFTGSIPWQNMRASTIAYQGAKSMEIRLNNTGTSDSIIQNNQYGIPDTSMPITPGKYYSFGGFIKSGGLSANSHQWFEWTSTPTGAAPNARPLPPWPFYFTPELAPGTSSTGWFYCNRVLQMPNGFPNVELRHRIRMDNAGTGSIYLDNMFFRELPAPSDGSWQQIFALHSTWKFFDLNAASAPPSNWYQTSFDDSAWPVGTAKFGAGSGPTGITTPLPQKKPKYYFRKQFSLTNAAFQDLLLEATCTDDYASVIYPLEIYLNGTRLDTSGIACVSSVGNTVLYYDLTPFIPLLQSGTNTIAVILNNSFQSTWDDVAFDLGLKAVPAGFTPPPPPPPPPPTPPTVTLSATDSAASENGDTGTFTATRSGSTAASLTVRYSIGGSASNGTDYAPLTGIVVIPAGAASAAITVAPIADALTEGTETVTAALSADSAYQIGSPSSGTVNIADVAPPPPPPPPTLPVVKLGVKVGTTTETGSKPAKIKFVRSGSTSAPITVDYTVSGTAANGVDYQTLSGSLVIPAGSGSVLLPVQAIPDSLTEPAETVILTLAPSAAYQVGSPAAVTVTIKGP